MIRIRYSNRVEQLIAALADALPPAGDVDAIFEGPWLVVPSRPLGLFVDLELARRRGIAGNIETLSVGGAFARLCVRASPDIVLIQRGHIIGELMAVLSDEAMRETPALAELQDYLVAAGTGADAVNRRRVDVARGLGALFDEWSWTKPELIAAWRAGDVVDGVDTHPLLRAERTLWSALFGMDGRFARRGIGEGRRYLTLNDVLAQGLDESWQPPTAIHMFGLSEIPRGLQPALSRLARRTQLEIYIVNPCREFWEDVNTARPRTRPLRAARRRRGPPSRGGDNRQLVFAGLTEPTSLQASGRTGAADGAAPGDSPAPPPDNPFLRAWGHAGRENTRLLNELSDGDFEALFHDPLPGDGGRPSGPMGDAITEAPATEATEATGAATESRLLRQLQQDILDRHPPREGADSLHLTPDASIQLLRAPNPRRELESIAAEIWRLVRESDPLTRRPPLRFSDIAVVIAGNDEPYLSLARAVFREAQDLPHAVVDQPIAWTSHLIEAVLALLALPLGGFTRREILDVVTHPNVRARFPDADPEVWLKLCEGLGIAHGTDRAALSDTYIAGDVFNWDQGLRRLALGVFARGPRSGVDDAVRLPRPDADIVADGFAADVDATETSGYVPGEVSPDLRPDADALALLVRSLLGDAAFARAAQLTLPEWMRFVRALMTAYVVPIGPDDESARLRVFSALDDIAAQFPPALTVGLGTVCELLRGALAGLRGTRGQMLGAGVVLGTLAALRSIPFRVVFVVGLDGDRFPSADHPAPLDVAPTGQAAGNITARQSDRYLFLEALLAARERLVLSHVDRDQLTGEPREPSAVLLELCDHLRRGYLDADATIARDVPLHRDEDAPLRVTFPAAAAEARARDAGVALHHAVPDVGILGSTEILRALSPQARQALGRDLRVIETHAARLPTGIEGQGPQRRVLRLTDLRRFLECPLQGSARVFLGLRDLPDDTEARETGDEPFDVPRWLERSLLGDVLLTAWNDAGGVPDASILGAHYDAAIARARPRQGLPVGLFRKNVRRRHLRILEQWLESLAAAPVPARGPTSPVCLGRPEPFAASTTRRPPLIITLAAPDNRPQAGPNTIEIHGTTEPQVRFGTRAGSLVLPTSDNADNNDKDSLRAFLDHVVLAASRPEGEDATDFLGAICRPSKTGPVGPPEPVEFPALASNRARAYLTALVGELLGQVHSYLFPCEAVFRSWDGGPKSLVDRIDETRADRFYRDHCSSRWGPVPDALEYPTPRAELAARYEESRFGLLRTERVPLARRGRQARQLDVSPDQNVDERRKLLSGDGNADPSTGRAGFASPAPMASGWARGSASPPTSAEGALDDGKPTDAGKRGEP